MRNYSWLVVLAIVIGTRAEAGVDKAGTTAANFLSVGSGAGILGMGGATLGASGDLSMLNWNVASLGSLNETQFVISHASLSGSSSQEWAAVGGRFHHSATRWSLSGLYQGDGAFEGRDATGVSTGTFNVSSMAFGGHVAQAFGDHLTLGLGAKFVTENLGTVSGWGGTYDAGMQFHTGPFGFGLAAQNIGGRMTYGSAIYPLPANIGAGLAYQLPATGLRFALDANFPSAYYGDVRAGVEWLWNDRLALRTGYRKEMGGASNDALTGPTFGMGAGLRGMWFDYGYLVGGAAGEGQHRIGLSFHPGALNWNGGDEISATPQVSAAPPAQKPTTAVSAPATSTSTATPKATAPITTPASAPTKSTPEAVTPSATAKAITPVTTTGAPTSAPSATAKAIAPVTTPTSAPTIAPAVVAPSATSKPIAPATTPTSSPTKTASAAVAPNATSKPIAPATTPTSTPTKTAPAAVAPSATSKPMTPVTTPASAPATATPSATARTEAPKTSVAPAPAVAAPKIETPKTDVPKPAPAVVPTEAPKVVTPQPSAIAPVPVPIEQRPATIKVRKGDTLASIGRTYGLTYAAIMMENNMVKQDIKPGQTLKLPKR